MKLFSIIVDKLSIKTLFSYLKAKNMNKLFSLTFLFLAGVSFSQNIGINSTGALPNNSAMLDVVAANKGVSFPNVALTSETDAATIPSPMTGLMVYNTNIALPCGAGLYFNNGTPAAPIWACFSKTTREFHAFDNLGRTNVTSNVLTLQPNCTINFIIPAGQIADVRVDGYLGGTNVSTSAGAYSIFDAVIYVDGAPLVQGGWTRSTINNPGGVNTNGFGGCTLSSWVTGLTAGAHTVQLFGRRFGGNSAVTLGGDCSTITNCGEVHATVIYR